MFMHKVRTLPALLAVFALAATRQSEAQVTSEDATQIERATPVRFRGQTLFEVRSPIGNLNESERVRAIEGRLNTVASGPASVLNEIRVVERERTSDVVAGENLVLSVTDRDAAPTGRTRQQLAADYASRLHTTLAREFSGRSARGLLTGLALTVLATVVLVALWRLTGQAFPRLARKVRSWQGTRIRSLRFQRVEFISAARMTELAVRSVRLLRWTLIVVAIAIYLQAVAGFFPWTRGFAQTGFAYVWGAIAAVLRGIASYLPNLIYIAVIVTIARFVIRAADTVFKALGRGDIHLSGFHREWARPTFQIARFIILAFAAVVVFPYLPGSSSPAFQGISIFLGVLLSLGSTSAVANVVAGVVITYMIPFRPGDRVKIADTVGDIVENNLLVVRVRTIKNVEITIPNSAVLGNHIVNYTTRARNDGLILHSTVTIGYDAPWRTVHELLIAAALKTPGILATPKPFVLQTSLDDFYISYEINGFTDEPNRMAAIYGELHQNIQDEFARGGVEIMSPHYAALRDGNTVAIPAEHLSKDYRAPAFRVENVAAGEQTS